MGSCFGPIFGGCHQGPIASTLPAFNPVLGLRLGPAHLLFRTHQLLMMPFSTKTGLERVGIAGPELELSLGWSAGSRLWTPLQKQETKRISGGSPVAASIPKSVLSCGREYQLLRE